MSIRKRNDSEGWRRGVRGAATSDSGIRQGRFPSSDPGTNPKGVGAYTEDKSGLTNKLPYEQSQGSRDVFDNVERNSGNGAPGPIKYGIS